MQVGMWLRPGIINWFRYDFCCVSAISIILTSWKIANTFSCMNGLQLRWHAPWEETKSIDGWKSTGRYQLMLLLIIHPTRSELPFCLNTHLWLQCLVRTVMLMQQLKTFRKLGIWIGWLMSPFSFDNTATTNIVLSYKLLLDLYMLHVVHFSTTLGNYLNVIPESQMLQWI